MKKNPARKIVQRSNPTSDALIAINATLRSLEGSVSSLDAARVYHKERLETLTEICNQNTIARDQSELRVNLLAQDIERLKMRGPSASADQYNARAQAALQRIAHIVRLGADNPRESIRDVLVGIGFNF